MPTPVLLCEPFRLNWPGRLFARLAARLPADCG